MKQLTRPLAFVIAAALLFGACGSDDTADATGTEADSAPAEDSATAEASAAEAASEEETAGSGTFPVTVETSSGALTIGAQPERIVSMSSTATEMLFAIGAGPQVTAVDSLSNYPSDAPITDLSAFEPNLEAIAALEPDLLVLGFPNDELETGLADLGVPVLVQAPAAAVDDTYDQIAQLGEATGQLDGAAAVNAEIRAGIEAIVAEVPESSEPVRVYHEIDDTFYSASSASFIGQMYELLGYENIADPADPDGNGFPQLQVDQIIDGDPTLIVYTNAYDYGADDIAGRPGWESLTAVANDNIVEVDADLSSRWGPRIVEFLQLIVDSSPVATG